MSAPTTEPTPAAPSAERIVVRAALASSQPTWRAPWLAAVLAAAWAAVIGLVITAIPVTAMWVATGAELDAWVDPVRSTGLVWVVAHDVAARIGTATYSLLPLGLLVVWGLLCGYAGRWAARASAVAGLREGAFLTAGAASSYAAILALVSWASGTADVWTSPARAFGIGLVFALAAFGWGVVRGAGLLPAILARVPAGLRVCVRAGLAAAATILSAGALLLAAALALHATDAIAMLQYLDAGALGGVVLLILCLGYLPVAIVWSSAYLLGAGVGIGGASVLSPFVTAPLPTQLPPMPLLAALPEAAGPTAWALPALGVVAGVVAGVIIGRRGQAGVLGRLALAAGAAALAAVVLAILARASYGSFGDIRLVRLGPPSQLVAILAGATVLIGAVPAALVVGRTRSAESDGEPADAPQGEPAGADAPPADAPPADAPPADAPSAAAESGEATPDA